MSDSASTSSGMSWIQRKLTKQPSATPSVAPSRAPSMAPSIAPSIGKSYEDLVTEAEVNRSLAASMDSDLQALTQRFKEREATIQERDVQLKREKLTNVALEANHRVIEAGLNNRIQELEDEIRDMRAQLKVKADEVQLLKILETPQDTEEVAKLKTAMQTLTTENQTLKIQLSNVQENAKQRSEVISTLQKQMKQLAEAYKDDIGIRKEPAHADFCKQKHQREQYKTLLEAKEDDIKSLQSKLGKLHTSSHHLHLNFESEVARRTEELQWENDKLQAEQATHADELAQRDAVIAQKDQQLAAILEQVAKFQEEHNRIAALKAENLQLKSQLSVTVEVSEEFMEVANSVGSSLSASSVEELDVTDVLPSSPVASISSLPTEIDIETWDAAAVDEYGSYRTPSRACSEHSENEFL